MLEVLDPEKRVIFLNIDKIIDTENIFKEKIGVQATNPTMTDIILGKINPNIFERHGKYVANIEKQLVIFLVTMLLKCGLKENEIAVLAVYNLFKNKLEKRLKVLYF